MNPIIQKIEHDIELYNETVIVNWCLGNTCNYSCSYCPEILHDASKPWLHIDVVKGFCQRAIDHFKIKNNKRLFFEFTGGEVALYKHFIELAKFLREQDALVSIISNGSRRMQYWEKVRPYLNHICLSFHPETAKIDHFKEVVEYLNQSVSVHVNLMMHPEYFDVCKELGQWVSKETKNITLAVQPLIIDFKEELYPYTEDQLQFISSPDLPCSIEREPVKYRGRLRKIFTDNSFEVTTAQQLISNGENNWKGWYCSVGVKQIVVDMDGDVYRGWCLEGGKLANIQDGNKIKFPELPILCNKSFCHCVLDVMNERNPNVSLLSKQVREQQKEAKQKRFKNKEKPKLLSFLW